MQRDENILTQVQSFIKDFSTGSESVIKRIKSIDPTSSSGREFLSLIAEERILTNSILNKQFQILKALCPLLIQSGTMGQASRFASLDSQDVLSFIAEQGSLMIDGFDIYNITAHSILSNLVESNSIDSYLSLDNADGTNSLSSFITLALRWKELLDLLPDSTLASIINQENMNALHIGVVLGSFDIVARILKLPSDYISRLISMGDSFGMTPLHYSITNIEIAATLLKHASISDILSTDSSNLCFIDYLLLNFFVVENESISLEDSSLVKLFLPTISILKEDKSLFINYLSTQDDNGESNIVKIALLENIGIELLRSALFSANEIGVLDKVIELLNDYKDDPNIKEEIHRIAAEFSKTDQINRINIEEPISAISTPVDKDSKSLNNYMEPSNPSIITVIGSESIIATGVEATSRNITGAKPQKEPVILISSFDILGSTPSSPLPEIAKLRFSQLKGIIHHNTPRTITTPSFATILLEQYEGEFGLKIEAEGRSKLSAAVNGPEATSASGAPDAADSDSDDSDSSPDSSSNNSPARAASSAVRHPVASSTAGTTAAADSDSDDSDSSPDSSSHSSPARAPSSAASHTAASSHSGAPTAADSSPDSNSHSSPVRAPASAASHPAASSHAGAPDAADSSSDSSSHSSPARAPSSAARQPVTATLGTSAAADSDDSDASAGPTLRFSSEIDHDDFDDGGFGAGSDVNDGAASESPDLSAGGDATGIDYPGGGIMHVASGVLNAVAGLFTPARNAHPLDTPPPVPPTAPYHTARTPASPGFESLELTIGEAIEAYNKLHDRHARLSARDKKTTQDKLENDILSLANAINANIRPEGYPISVKGLIKSLYVLKSENCSFKTSKEILAKIFDKISSDSNESDQIQLQALAKSLNTVEILGALEKQVMKGGKPSQLFTQIKGLVHKLLDDRAFEVAPGEDVSKKLHAIEMKFYKDNKLSAPYSEISREIDFDDVASSPSTTGSDSSPEASTAETEVTLDPSSFRVEDIKFYNQQQLKQLCKNLKIAFDNAKSTNTEESGNTAVVKDLGKKLKVVKATLKLVDDITELRGGGPGHTQDDDQEHQDTTSGGSKARRSLSTPDHEPPTNQIIPNVPRYALRSRTENGTPIKGRNQEQGAQDTNSDSSSITGSKSASTASKLELDHLTFGYGVNLLKFNELSNNLAWIANKLGAPQIQDFLLDYYIKPTIDFIGNGMVSVAIDNPLPALQSVISSYMYYQAQDLIYGTNIAVNIAMLINAFKQGNYLNEHYPLSTIALIAKLMSSGLTATYNGLNENLLYPVSIIEAASEILSSISLFQNTQSTILRFLEILDISVDLAKISFFESFSQGAFLTKLQHNAKLYYQNQLTESITKIQQDPSLMNEASIAKALCNSHVDALSYLAEQLPKTFAYFGITIPESIKEPCEVLMLNDFNSNTELAYWAIRNSLPTAAAEKFNDRINIDKLAKFQEVEALQCPSEALIGSVDYLLV